jgi:OHCU decarboxylase
MAATGSSLPPIDRLNSLTSAEFAEAIRPLFEAAPPLARALVAMRPFTSYADVLDRTPAAIATLGEADMVEVINAHPRIGESAADVKLLSELSYREQGYDREAGMDPAELRRVYRDLAELNDAYEAKFGFRFVVFVNGRSKAEIVPVLRARIERDRDTEKRTALEDMVSIARDRLRKLSGG